MNPLLRGLALILSLIGLLCGLGLVGLSRSAGAGLPLAILSALALGALFFERIRYKRILTTPPGDGWELTAERFIDPGTRRSVAVYFNPLTGRRAYVAVMPERAAAPSEPIIDDDEYF